MATLWHPGRWACPLLIGALAAGAAFGQPDYERERRWAAEVTPSIVVGDAVELKLASGRSFLAIYAAPPGAAAGIVVVHGLGVHPDWGLIGSLRSGLADAGYATLSVQMPVLAADALAEDYPPLFPEAAERLAAAVAWLHAKGRQRVGIVSHSMGSRMTDYYLAHAPDPGVAAWVAVGLSTFAGQHAGLKVPVLDLYGERDNAAVLGNAGKRAALLRARPGSGQVQVAGADHFFRDMEAELVRQARLFLGRHLK